jgi:hypothetical protein
VKSFAVPFHKYFSRAIFDVRYGYVCIRAVEEISGKVPEGPINLDMIHSSYLWKPKKKAERISVIRMK